MAALRASWRDDRIAPRDETWRRLRVSDASGTRLPALVVNLSPQGLMARVDETIAPGERLTFDFPFVGQTHAQVRWSLGGRIGCKFDQDIDDDAYPHVLTLMR